MKIGSANEKSTGMQTVMSQGTDAVTKSIQNQITNAQKQLQQLAENGDMSVEEKMKKRQEINQQISDMNNQIRQHQIELRKEQQQAKANSMNDMLGEKQPVKSKSENGQSSSLSQANMQAIISADSSMKLAKVQGSVATRMEGRVGILKSEIKQDAGSGNVEAKTEELAELEQKAIYATSAHMNTLNNVTKELEEAAKVEEKNEKTKTEPMKKVTESEDEVFDEAKEIESVHPISTYKPIDILL